MQRLLADSRGQKVDSNLNTALHLAVMESDCSSELVSDMVANGADVNARNKRNETPLHLVLRYNPSRVDLVHRLLVKGADANASDKNSIRPLHLVLINHYSVSSDRRMIKYLFDFGADPNASLSDGVAPIILAQVYEAAPSIVKLLLQRGARFGFIGENVSGFYLTKNNREVNRLLVKYSEMNRKLYDGKIEKKVNLHRFDPPNDLPRLKKYRNDCESEISKMLSVKIPGGITVFDIFLKLKMECPLPFTKCTYSEAYKHYPGAENAKETIYSDVVVSVIENRPRSSWLDVLVHVPVYAEKSSTGERVHLNGDCVTILFGYLTKEEIFSFVAAFDVFQKKKKESAHPGPGPSTRACSMMEKNQEEDGCLVGTEFRAVKEEKNPVVPQSSFKKCRKRRRSTTIAVGSGKKLKENQKEKKSSADSRPGKKSIKENRKLRSAMP